MVDNLISILVIFGLMAAGGYLVANGLLHVGKIEWVATKEEVEGERRRGREDRAAGRPFSPPSSPTSSAVWSAYERGFSDASHRAETDRLQRQHDALVLEIFYAKQEGARLLRELHMNEIPSDLEGEVVGRIVALLGAELRATRSVALAPISIEEENSSGPMSIRGSTPTPPEFVQVPNQIH